MICEAECASFAITSQMLIAAVWDFVWRMHRRFIIWRNVGWTRSMSVIFYTFWVDCLLPNRNSCKSTLSILWQSSSEMLFFMGNNYTKGIIVVIIVLLIILQVRLTLYIDTDIIYPKHLLFVVLVIIIIVMNTSKCPWEHSIINISGGVHAYMIS